MNCDLRSRWSGNQGEPWCHTHDLPANHAVAAEPEMWRDIAIRVGDKWSTVLDRLGLAEDATPDDVFARLAVAECAEELMGRARCPAATRWDVERLAHWLKWALDTLDAEAFGHYSEHKAKARAVLAGRDDR